LQRFQLLLHFHQRMAELSHGTMPQSMEARSAPQSNLGP
jgi:hypothetical protein